MWEGFGTQFGEAKKNRKTNQSSTPRNASKNVPHLVYPAEVRPDQVTKADDEKDADKDDAGRPKRGRGSVVISLISTRIPKCSRLGA